MSTVLAPQPTLNGDGVTTNSVQATSNRLRFTISRQNNQGVLLTLAVMLGNGMWAPTDKTFSVEPAGATRVVDDHEIDTPNLNDRYMLVYQGQQGNVTPLSGVTVYTDVLTAPASNTSVPTAGSVTSSSLAAGAVDSAALAADAVTIGKLAPAAFRLLHFTGHNLAGACTATGAKVGDVVLAVNTTAGTLAGRGSFEATITVADQIQQSAAVDLSAAQYDLLLLARS